MKGFFTKIRSGRMIVFLKKVYEHSLPKQNLKLDYHGLLNDKKEAQNIWSSGLVNEEPFAYRVVHQKTFLRLFRINTFAVITLNLQNNLIKRRNTDKTTSITIYLVVCSSKAERAIYQIISSYFERRFLYRFH